MRTLTQSLVLLLGLASVTQAIPAQATTVTQCNEAGLRAAIEETADGGTINLNCGTNNISLNSASELVINKNLTINGNGAGIHGKNKTRIFRTTKNLTLRNLTLRNGRVSSKANNFSCEGAAVHVTFGQLLLDNVTLTKNFAPRGGAICGNWQAKLDIRNSTFTENTAHQGGAIATNTSDLSIQGTTFTGNTTSIGQGLNGIGGALSTYDDLDKSTPIKILDSRFDGNKSFHEGGAAFIAQSNGVNLELRNTTFVNNHAQISPQTGIGSGGALKLAHNGGQSEAKLINVMFANNIADQEGGAVWAGGSNANLNLNFRQVTFYGNVAGRVPDPQHNETAGGAILMNSRGRMLFVNNTFAENTAGNETSGAIAAASNFNGGLVDHSKVILRNTIFHNNCSLKDILGTPERENCNHFTHARTAHSSGNNNFVHKPFAGNNNVFEWSINQHAPSGQAFPVTANSKVQDVNVRSYQDNGDAAPDHPCSDVASGSGGACS